MSEARMSPLRIVLPPRKSTSANSWRFRNSVSVAVPEPSHLGRGFPQYTAGAWRQGTAGPPPFENVVPGITAPLSHIMLVARGAPLTVVMSAESTRRWKMLPSGNPGTWYCPKVAFITSDDAPPNEATSLLLREYFSPRRRLALRDRIASPPTSSSIPR